MFGTDYVHISRFFNCHGDTIHPAQLQSKCYPPHLLVCIHQKTPMCSYLHRDGAPADTSRNTAAAHDNLFSRHGLGCFHPKRFSNHFGEEGEYDEDAVARVKLTQRMWESSIDAIEFFEAPARSKRAFCHKMSRLVICRCGWIKDMTLLQAQWSTTHRGSIRHCVEYLCWVPTYTWSITSTNMTQEILIHPGILDGDVTDTFNRERSTRTPLVKAIVSWILTLTSHVDHKGRCAPPHSIVGQSFQTSGQSRSVYEVTGAVGHRDVKDNTGRSQGHFWAEIQRRDQVIT